METKFTLADLRYYYKSRQQDFERLAAVYETLTEEVKSKGSLENLNMVIISKRCGVNKTLVAKRLRELEDLQVVEINGEGRYQRIAFNSSSKNVPYIEELIKKIKSEK